jgi:hypothetical protein
MASGDASRVQRGFQGVAMVKPPASLFVPSLSPISFGERPACQPANQMVNNAWQTHKQANSGAQTRKRRHHGAVLDA